MPRFKVAHLHEQGQDLIIVPLDSNFGHKAEDDQQEAIGELQMHAAAAGLRGHVIPVWDSGGGRMAFIAPQNWHSYFKSINLQYVHQNLNREIYW